MGEYFSDSEDQLVKHCNGIREDEVQHEVKLQFAPRGNRAPASFHFPVHHGYSEARRLIGDGNTQRLEQLASKAIDHLTSIFSAVEENTQQQPITSTTSKALPPRRLANLRLSPSLQEWKRSQHAQGRILPPKGHGLRPVPLKTRKLLGAENWPAPLITRAALFGCGTMNLLQGAYDAPTLMSNYLNDLGFFLEHGYHKVFPGFEELLKIPHKNTSNRKLGEEQRHSASEIGLTYIRTKVALEEKYHRSVGSRSAVIDSRSTMQTIALFESSLLGVAGEAIARGYDPAGVMADLVFSNPGTDVVDVGRDLHNCEVMNSFLNTGDFTSPIDGDESLVTEEKLRKVYDAYAHTGARGFIDRWSEPTSRMNAQLYTWHILNDRHMFLRLAVLGYSMCRGGNNMMKGKGNNGRRKRSLPHQQREADMDEAFDESLHTTGFSRPLRGACDGGDPCDAVKRVALAGIGEGRNKKDGHSAVVYDLWRRMVTDPLEYAAGGKVDPAREDQLVEDLGYAMASAYSRGYFIELTWLCSHASHHAWQVNYLFEAAMFGSLLDDGALCGKLDRAN